MDPLGSERSWLTPYNFVQNNPINLVDPTGMLDGGPGDPNNEITTNYVLDWEVVVMPDAPKADGGGNVSTTDAGCHYCQNRELNSQNLLRQSAQIYLESLIAQSRLDYNNGQRASPRWEGWDYILGKRTWSSGIGLYQLDSEGYLDGPAPITGTPPIPGGFKNAPRVIAAMSSHGVQQAITRGFKTSDILNIVKNGKAVYAAGRYGPQWRYMLNGNTVVVNATTNKLITVFSNAPGTAKKLGAGAINSF